MTIENKSSEMKRRQFKSGKAQDNQYDEVMPHVTTQLSQLEHIGFEHLVCCQDMVGVPKD